MTPASSSPGPSTHIPHSPVNTPVHAGWPPAFKNTWPSMRTDTAQPPTGHWSQRSRAGQGSRLTPRSLCRHGEQGPRPGSPGSLWHSLKLSWANNGLSTALQAQRQTARIKNTNGHAKGNNEMGWSSPGLPAPAEWSRPQQQGTARGRALGPPDTWPAQASGPADWHKCPHTSACSSTHMAPVHTW